MSNHTALQIYPMGGQTHYLDLFHMDKNEAQQRLANIDKIFQSHSDSLASLVSDTRLQQALSLNGGTHIDLELPFLKAPEAFKRQLEEIIEVKLSELELDSGSRIEKEDVPSHNLHIRDLNSPLSQLHRWQNLGKENPPPRPEKSNKKHEYSNFFNEGDYENLRNFFQTEGNSAKYIQRLYKLFQQQQKAKNGDLPGKEKTETHESPPSDEELRRVRDELWMSIIADAVARSPAAALDKLSEKERKRVLREEWLVKDPLTGICTGLVIDYIINRELNPYTAQMLPSDQARHWEKLLIPSMLKVMEAHYCESPEELNKEHHYRAIYFEMMKIVGEQAHLSASIKHLHQSLFNLGRVIIEQSGHCLICIERDGAPVADNHAIYLNPDDRLIADNGIVIEVPENADFGDFVYFYMDKMGYFLSADKFSLISVEKDSNFESVRKATTFNRSALSAKLVMKNALSYFSWPSSPMVDWDVTGSGPYPGFHGGK